MTKNPTPLESMEQELFVGWLEQNNIKFTAIPNSTFTRSWSQKNKNHSMGLRPGLLDLIIVIRPDQAIDGIGKVVFCEMKRQKGGTVSDDQQGWIDALNSLGSVSVVPIVCKGAAEAARVMKTQIKSWHHTAYVTQQF